MKKLLLLVVCCLCLCGCGKEKENNEFHASNFTWKEGIGFDYAEGNIKNNSSKTCNWIYMELTYSNEDSTESNNTCAVYEELAPGETIQFSCMYSGNLSNITDYRIQVDEIICYE